MWSRYADQARSRANGVDGTLDICEPTRVRTAQDFTPSSEPLSAFALRLPQASREARSEAIGLRADGQGALRRQRVLAIDDDGNLAVGREQIARRPALIDAQRVIDHRARAAVIGHPRRDVLQEVPVVPDVLVRVPQARQDGLAAAVDDGRSGGRLKCIKF